MLDIFQPPNKFLKLGAITSKALPIDASFLCLAVTEPRLMSRDNTILKVLLGH